MSIFQDLLEDGFRSVQTIRYAELASSVIIVFDHAVTLDQEIELIWKSGWSLGKCLFLLNRYYSLATVLFNNYILFTDQLTDKVCLNWFRWQGATGIIAFALGELILQLRLYALYFLDKRVLTFMICTFLGCLAASATLISISLTHVKASSHVLPGTPFCIPSNIPANFYRWWIPILVSETVLCCLALYRGLQTYFNRRNLFQSGKELIEILIRDSVLYFLILFGVYLCNTIIFIIGDATQIESAVGYSVAMSCVMGNRLCLNVRGMVHTDEDLPNLSREAINYYSSQHRGPSMRGTRQGSQGVVVRAVQVDSESSAIGKLSEFEMDELRGMKVKV